MVAGGQDPRGTQEPRGRSPRISRSHAAVIATVDSCKGSMAHQQVYRLPIRGTAEPGEHVSLVRTVEISITVADRIFRCGVGAPA